MYIHLFQYDHILVWVMKTFSTPASSIFASIAGMDSNCGRLPMARSMRQMSSPFLASVHLAMNSGVAT
jgi:hypothetical protein